MSVEIKRPYAGEPSYPVILTGGTGPAGIMYALVKATRDREEWSLPADAVYAMVFSSSTGIPPHHPNGSTPGMFVGNDLWCFDHLPCPKTGPGSGAQLFVVAWAVFSDGSGGSVELQSPTQPFFAVAGTTLTSTCGSGMAPGDSAQGAAGKGVALTTTPLLWALVIAGFEAGKTLFNGKWQLELRQTEVGHCVWDNRGAGAPHIELRCEAPLAITWRLTLRDGAGVVEEFTRCAFKWNPLTANELQRTESNGATADGPRSLTITPG